MSYTSQTHLNNRYHSVNVNRWLDMDGTANAGTMAARLAAAIAAADAWVADNLRSSPYSHVAAAVTDSTGATPLTLVDAATKYCGYWLSTADGVKSYDRDGAPVTRLYVDYLAAREIMADIRSKNLTLDVL